MALPQIIQLAHSKTHLRRAAGGRRGGTGHGGTDDEADDADEQEEDGALGEGGDMEASLICAQGHCRGKARQTASCAGSILLATAK